MALNPATKLIGSDVCKLLQQVRLVPISEWSKLIRTPRQQELALREAREIEYPCLFCARNDKGSCGVLTAL
jgi:hypothetical protein